MQNITSNTKDILNIIIHELRNKITWLDIKPESYINISEIANLFNVSRTPIKEALINLEANGWVQRQGSHFIVTPLSLERLKEISEVRSVIEIKAYHWAMDRLTQEEKIILEQYKEKIENIEVKASKKEIISLDIDIHLFLFKVAKNRYVYNLLERSIYHALRFWMSKNLSPEGILDDMHEMLEAIQMKNENKLEEVSLRHIKNWANGIIAGI
jgi:GntR family transcriptional regulator, rspAB operon transcriptional repressor